MYSVHRLHIIVISTENFYWILYHQLLRPVGVECWYFYPFGTRQCLSLNEFVGQAGIKKPFVLFHYDQEPIWCDDFGSNFDQDQRWEAFTAKLPKFLANSERSGIKKQVCASRHMLDWYYFYHGFAALNWYRDAQYVDHCQEVVSVFSSFSHLVSGPRAYRMSLTAKLLDLGLYQYGDISFHGTVDDCEKEIQDDNSALSSQEKTLIQDILCANRSLPLLVDTRTVDGDASAHFGHQEYRLWQRSFVHLVNETVFYDHKLHLTEKIFKPIVALRPFVLVAAPGNLEYLRSYGFRTFDQWWDEGYDSIQDPSDRLDAVVRIVKGLCDRPISEVKDMLADMQPILDHNKQHFFGEFRRAIADELVDNFDTCIRTWNNGRVDGRHLPAHPDLASVKQLLSN